MIPIGGLVLVGAYELYLALSLSLAEWEAHPIGNIVAGLFLALPGVFFGAVAAAVLSLVIDSVLPWLWPRYARVRRFRAGLKRYQAELTEYELWLRRQAEAFWQSLSGVGFERELGRLFSKIGYRVKTTPRRATAVSI
ncbi:MAG TPA: hypothetical protein VJR47_04440 [Stellaceae bacterium]|nr:hypothetical protein [Stellaceae bacterium]